MPSSIKSILVTTPIVRSPWGSTTRASYKASELAKSVFAADSASIKAFGLVMKLMIKLRICDSMSLDWPLTGTFVRPGKSTRVKSTTFGEKILKVIGTSLTFLVVPPAI